MIKNTKQAQYFDYIGNQLTKKFVSSWVLSEKLHLFDLILKSDTGHDITNINKQRLRAEVSQMDNIYLSIIEKLMRENINYYIKNITVDVDCDNAITDLNYDYYEISDDIAETNVNINFLS